MSAAELVGKDEMATRVFVRVSKTLLRILVMVSEPASKLELTLAVGVASAKDSTDSLTQAYDGRQCPS